MNSNGESGHYSVFLIIFMKIIFVKLIDRRVFGEEAGGVSAGWGHVMGRTWSCAFSNLVFYIYIVLCNVLLVLKITRKYLSINQCERYWNMLNHTDLVSDLLTLEKNKLLITIIHVSLNNRILDLVQRTKSPGFIFKSLKYNLERK